MIRHAPTRTALALAAHGSSFDQRCAAPVRLHARAIAARGLYDDVVCIYYKQRPFFGDLYGLTGAGRITVVPVMTAQGYYASVVLPRQLSAARAARGRDVAIAPALGELEGLAGLILRQAADAAAGGGLALASCRLLVVGHGTWRAPGRSGASTWRAARAAARGRLTAGAHAAFLEQLPPIRSVFDAIPGAEPVIVVPNLIASGSHGAEDVPRALGLAGPGPGDVNGRPAIVTEAVGQRPETADLILEAAARRRAP